MYLTVEDLTGWGVWASEGKVGPDWGGRCDNSSRGDGLGDSRGSSLGGDRALGGGNGGGGDWGWLLDRVGVAAAWVDWSDR